LFLAACNRFVAPLPERPNSGDDWLMAGANAGRTSKLARELQLPLAEIARLKLTSAAAQNLFVHNGMLFAPTLDGKLSTIDLATKRFLSKKKMPGGHAGTIVLRKDGMVLAMRLGKETLFHFDLAKRNKLWEIDAGDIASEPLLTDSCVYVAALNEHVDAYWLRNGERRWQFRTTGQMHASPALAENILIAATNRGKVYGLDASTGKSIWEVDLAQPILSTPVIAEQQVFLGASRDLIVALDLRTGAEKWRTKTEGRIFNAPAVNDSLVIFGASDGVVRALRKSNGATAWRFRATSGIGASPLIVGSKVFFGSLDKIIYGLHASDGAEFWQWTLEGRVRTNPIVWKDHLIVASEDRYLYLFGPEENLGTNGR
jgi:outer membrane protein assembly factor BamB